MALGLLHKARSQKGASMMMALLLFLVCMTVASVALTAATAASGRLSDQREADNSYYNVTSAAGLFWDTLSDGVQVKITRSAIQDAANSFSGWKFSVDDDVNLTVDGDSLSQLNLKPSNATLFQILSVDLLVGEYLPSPSDSRNYSLVLPIDSFEWVSRTIDTSSEFPVEITFSSVIEYASFQVKMTSGASLTPVSVSIIRNADGTYEGGTYDFVFIEDGVTDRFRCTLTAESSIDNSIPRITLLPSGERQFEWVTTVNWAPICMNVGGA